MMNCYLHAGMGVALVVNNLGGTSNLELYVMTNAAIRFLGMPEHVVLLSLLPSHVTSALLTLPPVDRLQLQVLRVYTGSLMTSLEMAGVSLTLLKLFPHWHSYLGEGETCRRTRGPFKNHSTSSSSRHAHHCSRMAQIISRGGWNQDKSGLRPHSMSGVSY